MLKNKILYFIFFIIFNQVACPKLPTCISLGRACGPALNLRELKIRNEAYPFDWISSPLESLCKALEEVFFAFLTDIHL